VLNRAFIRRYKSKERLEYKGTRIKIYDTEERRPVIGLYHVVNYYTNVQILTLTFTIALYLL